MGDETEEWWMSHAEGGYALRSYSELFSSSVIGKTWRWPREIRARVRARAASNSEPNRINREHRNSKCGGAKRVRIKLPVAGVNLVSSLRIERRLARAVWKGTTSDSEKEGSFGEMRIFLAAFIPPRANGTNFSRWHRRQRLTKWQSRISLASLLSNAETNEIRAKWQRTNERL